MDERLTIQQVLEFTVEILGDIRVPAKHTEDIGIPIGRAMSNLSECIRAFEADKAAKEGEAHDTHHE